MKKIFAIFVFLLFAASAHAQLEYETVMRNGQTYYGLQNRSKKWVVQPEYQDIKRLPNGYWALRNAHFKWGIFGPTGKLTVPFVYDDVLSRDGNGVCFPLVAVKQGGYCGLIAFDTYTVVLPSSYSGLDLDTRGYLTATSSNGNTKTYDKQTLFDKLAEIKAAARQREIEEFTRKQREIARKKKEEELASFTTYAKQYVEPKVNAWQQKGEFETTAEYSKRVTGANRAARIAELTAEAERKFIAEHADLNKEMRFSLGLYDADNETFKLTASGFGDFFLRVPRSKAPDFKQQFAQYVFADPTYYIADDRIALGAFALKNASGETYTYDKGQQAAYATYEIAYDKFDFQPIASTQKPDGTAQPTQKSVVLQGAVAAKPVLTILSPATGDSYTQKEVTIRYNVRSGDGGKVKLTVSINGGDSFEPPVTKGVRSGAEELVLTLPQNPGQECNILFFVENTSGYFDQGKLILRYTGDRRKPRLHLLAVGVGDYADAAIPKLGQAAKDASDFAAAVMARPNTQYSRVAAPVVLTDRAATAAGIKSALVRVSREAEQDDVVMLFFSGHGAEEGRKVYFLPSDAEKDNYFTTGVKFDDIRDMMDELVAKQCRVVVFMDTCHSGAMFNTKGAADNFTIASPDVVGFYSSTRSEKSNESEKWSNGIFTKALIDGIKGAAADAQQHVTIQGLDNYVKRVVDRETGGRQSPIVENRVGDFILF